MLQSKALAAEDMRWRWGLRTVIIKKFTDLRQYLTAPHPVPPNYTQGCCVCWAAASRRPSRPDFEPTRQGRCLQVGTARAEAARQGRARATRLLDHIGARARACFVVDLADESANHHSIALGGLRGTQKADGRAPAPPGQSYTIKCGRTNTPMRQHERPRAVLCAAATRSHRGIDHAEAHLFDAQFPASQGGCRGCGHDHLLALVSDAKRRRFRQTLPQMRQGKKLP